jgi:hypothetical protein
MKLMMPIDMASLLAISGFPEAFSLSGKNS